MKTSVRVMKLSGMLEIFQEPLVDHRGSLFRLHDQKTFEDIGVNMKLNQESLFRTSRRNTVRGLHFSLPPRQESKIITAVRGITQWVSVDLRKKSPTFGEWQEVILSGETRNSLWTEAGFAHGCLSLTDDCELLIKTDTAFSDVRSAGIIWNDQNLKIVWRINPNIPLIISEEHRRYGAFAEFLKTRGEEL